MADYKNPPIHRHDALAPFSRDHYVGLVQARHLIRAAGADDAERHRAIAEFIEAWRDDILSHFEDEERLLLSLMADSDQQRMLAEHRRLAELESNVRGQRKQASPDPDLLRETGELLEQHIRWEERELFNRLQDQAGQAALSALHHSTAEIEASRDRDLSCSRSTTR